MVKSKKSWEKDSASRHESLIQPPQSVKDVIFMTLPRLLKFPAVDVHQAEKIDVEANGFVVCALFEMTAGRTHRNIQVVHWHHTYDPYAHSYKIPRLQEWQTLQRIHDHLESLESERRAGQGYGGGWV